MLDELLDVLLDKLFSGRRSVHSRAESGIALPLLSIERWYGTSFRGISNLRSASTDRIVTFRTGPRGRNVSLATLVRALAISASFGNIPDRAPYNIGLGRALLPGMWYGHFAASGCIWVCKMVDDTFEDPIEEQGFALGAVYVGELAPEEAELYPELIEAYRSEGKPGKTGDHPLALGLGEIIAAVSPIFFEAGNAVAESLWKILKTAAENSVEKTLADQLSLWVKCKLAKPVPFKLSERQVDSIVEAVEAKVARMRADNASGGGDVDPLLQ
jgi:hypothetical protein